MAAPSRNSAGRRSSERACQGPPQLSCDLCRERKVKCDKLNPCSNCKSAGVICVTVYRHRLSRGRHVHRNNNAPNSDATQAEGSVEGEVGRTKDASPSTHDLLERIGRLENLIEINSKAVMDANRTDPLSMTVTPIRSRDPIELPSQSGDQTQIHHRAIGPQKSGLNILRHQRGLDSIGSEFAGAQFPSQEVSAQLCSMYLQRVDPIVKILHRPTIDQWLRQKTTYLNYPPNHTSIVALRSAIDYASVSVLTEIECQSLFDSTRCQAVGYYSSACESALEDANLLSTNDIAVVQALVIYLNARRCNDRSTATWVLVGVAVRLSENIGLHLVTPIGGDGNNSNFFDQQMRARLWLAVCSLDLQAVLTAGSRPLIDAEAIPPILAQFRHINDSDFDPHSVIYETDREELTDTTFAYVMYQLQLTSRLINFGSQRAFLEENSSATTTETRMGYAKSFEDKALGVLRFCDPESSPYAWFTWHGTQCLVASMRILAVCPVSQGKILGTSESSHFEANRDPLRMSLRVVEKVNLVNSDRRGENFRWYAHVPWPLLAMAIIECSRCEDPNLALTSWPVIEKSYQLHRAVHAKLNGADQQGPLLELMNKARAKVQDISTRMGLGQDFTPASNPNRAKESAAPMVFSNSNNMEGSMDDAWLTNMFGSKDFDYEPLFALWSPNSSASGSATRLNFDDFTLHDFSFPPPDEVMHSESQPINDAFHQFSGTNY